MKNYTLIYLIILTLFIACKGEVQNNKARTKAKVPLTTSNNTDTLARSTKVLDAPKIFIGKTINVDDVLINGHSITLSKSEFEKLYPKIDSVKTQAWDCGNPFEWLDKQWMIETYGNINKEKGSFDRYNWEVTTIYVNNVEFDTK